MRNICLILIIGLLTLGCKNPKEKQENKLPEVNYAVGLDFINDYVHTKEGDKFIQTHELVTQTFKDRYQVIIDSALQKDPEIGLGFDPVIDGQDFPSKFKIKAVDSTNTYLTLESDDKNWSNFDIVVKLINQKNQTMVDGAGIINIPQNLQPKR